MTDTALTPLLAEPWLRWQHQAVRDLAWVIASPPLLQPAPEHSANAKDAPRWLDLAWCRASHAAREDWLAAVDADPTTLHAHLEAERDHRLGSHFESLLAFWLGAPDNPQHELLARNLPLRQDGRTLGELDFLVRDRLSGEVQHWEVAVKFFLGVRPGGAARYWVGPGLRDRLDLKLDRLRQHQLRLTRSPEGRRLLDGLGLPAARPVCLLKGCLFYPADAERSDWAPQEAGPGHLQGWWQDHAGFRLRWGNAGLSWLRLPKANWMTAVVSSEELGSGVDCSTLLAQLPVDGARSATCVVGLRNGHEVTRGFVVADDWWSGT